MNVRTQLGQGTTFLIKIPLTLGIIEGTVMKIGDHFITIQSTHISELLRRKEISIIEIDGERRALEVRGQYIPVLNLNQIIDLKIPNREIKENAVILILEYEANRIALEVDEVIGIQNVVVKPLPHMLEATKGINGFTILGNGIVSNILNTSYIFEFHQDSKVAV